MTFTDFLLSVLCYKNAKHRLR